MVKKIMFPQSMRKSYQPCYSQGRNGSIRTTGVEVFAVPGFEPKISPVNSKGLVGNCYIEIDHRSIPALIKLLREAAAEIKAGLKEE